jgi:hypothetical protein
MLESEKCTAKIWSTVLGCIRMWWGAVGHQAGRPPWGDLGLIEDAPGNWALLTTVCQVLCVLNVIISTNLHTKYQCRTNCASHFRDKSRPRHLRSSLMLWPSMHIRQLTWYSKQNNNNNKKTRKGLAELLVLNLALLHERNFLLPYLLIWII